MSSKRSALLILLLLHITVIAFAQRDTVGLKTIIEKTAKYSSAYPIEKVYLHMDKPFYAAGDTIWFKAYVTIDKHQPTVLSSIIYVDIANEQDSLMKILKLPVVNGVAAGNLALGTGEFKQGNYHLRGYTAWMRNFDPDYFFNKTITIGNAVENNVKTDIYFNTTTAAGKAQVNARVLYKEADDAALANRKVSWVVKTATGDEISKGKGTTDARGGLSLNFAGPNTNALQNCQLVTVVELGNRKEYTGTFPLKTLTAKDVQFFPEGGELTVGIRSRVAFKAINTNGMGVDIKGTVTDNSGTVVANITTAHLGMGMFALQPEDGKTYKANITFADGSQTSYELPRARPSGIGIAVFNNDPANLNLKISCNETFLAANQGKPFYIIAQNGGAIYFAAQTSLQSQAYSAAISKEKFPTGLVQLTLLSNRGIPLSERVVFIQHNDMLNLSMTADKKIYTTRQKVKVTVSAKNKTLPVAGEFSVSVVDEGKVPSNENNETTILSNLLLTSELKGYIEQPSYYFISKDENAATNLDILMLTQGYRRISFNNIRADRLPNISILPEQQGIEVTGMLRNNTGMPIAKGNLRLQIPAKNFYAETVTDMTGGFKFSKLAFNDSSQVIISARNNYNNKNLMINVSSETYSEATNNPYALDAANNIDSLYQPYLANSKKRYDNLHILKEVTIKSTSAVKKASHLDYPGFMGLSVQADYMIGAERLKGCADLKQCLPSILLGVLSDDQYVYLAKNYRSQQKIPMQIFVDGKPVDLRFLSGINPASVETIEMYKTDGVSGINKTYGTEGIVIISMHKVVSQKITFAELQNMIPKGNLLTFTPQAYAVTREFYSPKYDPLKPHGALGGDLRSTIYWSPKVVTDKTGAASFEFFNADGRGTYRATIEGMDADGNLGRYVFRYTVK